jgi:hypothetical protein
MTGLGEDNSWYSGGYSAFSLSFQSRPAFSSIPDLSTACSWNHAFDYDFRVHIYYINNFDIGLS